MNVSTIILAIGYVDTEENEKKIVADLNRKIRYVSDERRDPLKSLHDLGFHLTFGLERQDWKMYMGVAERLDVPALVKYFMDIHLIMNYHMQIFIAEAGTTNFQSYWNGGGDAQTQFKGNAKWKRG